MGVLLSALLVVATGCGRYGFEDRVAGDGNGLETSTVDAAGCASAPNSYTFVVGTSRYRTAGTDQWLNSEKDCEEGSGTHLVTVDSQAELVALTALAGTTRVWIGVSDRITEGAFVEVTGGVPTYLPWAANAPTTNGGDCVSWDPTMGTYVDEDCGLARDRICECDGRDPAPNTY